MLKGLIFDLDGVLTDTAKFHLTAWNDLAKKLGIDLTEKQLNSLRGISRMDSLNMILEYGNKKINLTSEQKERLAEEKNSNFLKQVDAMSSSDILPGIMELLQDAEKANLKMCIASASHNAPKILNKLGIANRFEQIVNPATIRHGKPDPEIYEKAQQLLQLNRDEVISFEDAAAGVEAIKAAGQFAVGIGDKQMLKDTDYVVESTKELKLAKIEAVFLKNNEKVG